ncbi:MAG: transcriptional regulator [Bacteroidia bacterium]
MENYILDRDIILIYVQAASFPNGVMAAHQQLRDTVQQTAGRRFFGLSRPEGNSGISYKAATEELLKGEGARLGFETLIIPKGNYKAIELKDFMKDIPSIGKAFAELLVLPDKDPNGYCVEEYVGENDVRCMIRLK